MPPTELLQTPPSLEIVSQLGRQILVVLSARLAKTPKTLISPHFSRAQYPEMKIDGGSWTSRKSIGGRGGRLGGRLVLCLDVACCVSVCMFVSFSTGRVVAGAGLAFWYELRSSS